MVRNYKKKPPKYDEDDIARALRDVQDNNLSAAQAANVYGINRNFLIRRLNGEGDGKRGRKPELTPDEEKELANCLKTMSTWGFGLSRQEVCDVVQEYVLANNLRTTFAGGRPGKDWVHNFMTREVLSAKKPELLEAVRRQATSDPFIIYGFYELLWKCVKDLDLADKPKNLWNLDETSVCSDPSRGKVVGEKGKSVHRTVQGTGKQNTTVLACVNAAGKLLPPLIIYSG